MPRERRRIAIIGAGIGAEHLAGWLASPARFEVATICDLDRARAAPLIERAELGGSSARFDDNLDRVLADDSIDIVDICLPPRLHRDTLLAALSTGRHVVCEKPLVASLAEADAIEAAASAANRVVMPVFQYRFGRGLEALRHLMDCGLAGKPLIAAIETHWNRQSDYYSVDWRGRWASELGGAVVGHAIHAHDLISHVLGPVASVQASLATRVNPIEVEDCAAILLTMASGALVTSSVTLGSATDRSRLRFCFSDLSAESALDPYAPADGAWTYEARGGIEELPGKQAAIDAGCRSFAERRGSELIGFARQFELFDDALRLQLPPPVTLGDARASLELVTALYASSTDGKRVALPLTREVPGYADWRPPTEART